jgi:hypothetical protein
MEHSLGPADRCGRRASKWEDLLADGTTSFPLRKVLDVDPDAKQDTITQRGRRRPIVLAVPDAIVTGAMIERAARGHGGAEVNTA